MPSGRLNISWLRSENLESPAFLDLLVSVFSCNSRLSLETGPSVPRPSVETRASSTQACFSSCRLQASSSSLSPVLFSSAAKSRPSLRPHCGNLRLFHLLTKYAFHTPSIIGSRPHRRRLQDPT